MTPPERSEGNIVKRDGAWLTIFAAAHPKGIYGETRESADAMTLNQARLRVSNCPRQHFHNARYAAAAAVDHALKSSRAEARLNRRSGRATSDWSRERQDANAVR